VEYLLTELVFRRGQINRLLIYRWKDWSDAVETLKAALDIKRPGSTWQISSASVGPAGIWRLEKVIMNIGC